MANYEAIKNDVYRIRRYIFIGDSYGAGQNMSDTSKNWINKTVSNLGLTGSQYYRSAVSGSGFIGQSGVTTFLQQLQRLNVTAPHLITDIIVCGGWNDGGKDDSALFTALETFMTYVKSNFPIAKVWLGFTSWCDSYSYGTRTSATNPTWNVRGALSVYERAGRYGYAFIGNMQYVMHHTSLFTGDGLHPNENGQQAIADALASALMGGTVNAYYYNKTTFTKGSLISSAPDMWAFLDNGHCGVNIYNQGIGPQFTFNQTIDIVAGGFNGSGTTVVTLGTFDNACLRGGAYSELQADMVGYVQTSGNVNHQAHLLLRLGLTSDYRQNTLECAVACTNDSGVGYKSFNNVTMIWFPTPNVYMHGLSMFC